MAYCLFFKSGEVEEIKLSNVGPVNILDFFFRLKNTSKIHTTTTKLIYSEIEIKIQIHTGNRIPIIKINK